MAIELVLEGKLEKEKEREDFSAFLKELCEHKKIKMEDYDRVVDMELCPQGHITCSYEGLFVSIVAQTNVIGPGFHAYVCSFFDDILASSGVSFEVSDPTSYYEKRDFEALKYNYFYPWLQSMADYIVKRDEEEEGLSLCWNDEVYQPSAKKGMVVTPLGYISVDDFKHLEVEALAEKFFIWNQFDRDAKYYRNCAYALLWKDCFFEYSAMNEESDKACNMIADYIEIAYDKDATLPLPLDVYHSLCETIMREPLRLHGVQEMKETKGYRHDFITYTFGNWLIQVPGFSEFSYDKTTKTLHFMAPYKHSGEPWQWFINAFAFDTEKDMHDFLNPSFLQAQQQNEERYFINNGMVKGKVTACEIEDYTEIHAQFLYEQELLDVTLLAKAKEDVTLLKEVLQAIDHKEVEEEFEEDLKN